MDVTTNLYIGHPDGDSCMRDIAKSQEPAPIMHGSLDQKDNNRYLSLKVLWVKVIIRAAADYVLYRDSKNLKMKRWAMDAKRWLFEPSDLFNSLESICYHFDLDISKVRKFAKELTRDKIQKMEFLERSPRSATKLITDTWSN